MSEPSSDQPPLPNMSSIGRDTSDGPDILNDDEMNDSSYTTTLSSKRARDVDDIGSVVKRSVAGALNLQHSLFVLDTPVILPAAAQAFQVQANRWDGNYSVNQVVVEPASDLIETFIYADVDQRLIERELIPLWMENLTVPQVAELVTKYFGNKPDTGRTLEENFGKVAFRFSYNDASYEGATSLDYVGLTRAHELTSVITPAQHALLISIFEKRLPPDSKIRTDYFTAKKLLPSTAAPETWRKAFARFFELRGPHPCLHADEPSVRRPQLGLSVH